MNAINKEMIDFMAEAGEYVDKNGVGLDHRQPGIRHARAVFRRRGSGLYAGIGQGR
jgi:hypothetical protein